MIYYLIYYYLINYYFTVMYICIFNNNQFLIKNVILYNGISCQMLIINIIEMINIEKKS